MDIREQMEKIYGDMSPDNIPWNILKPPDLLVRAVESGIIKPCRAADLGCGAGNYAVWMTRNAFDVTGFDISEKAIEHARNLADHEGVACRFKVVDLLGDMNEYHGAFDFAYDWELLHHIFPEDRPRYLENVRDILVSGGLYFSVCFSDKDTTFNKGKKYIETQIGTVLYFSSEDELKKLYDPLFKIIELKTVEIPGKYAPHMANAAWLKRK